MKKAPILYFNPEGYSISGPKLMGRNAAGHSFLRGFARYSLVDQMRAFVEDASFGPLFSEMIHSFGSHKPVEVLQLLDSDRFNDSVLYFPGPTLVEPAWQRIPFGSDRYSLCGITHTTASTLVMDSVSSWLEAPLQNWDAIICTSQAVKATLDCILEEKKSYLNHRFKADLEFTLPQLPVIPLGICAEDFLYSNEQKIFARHQLKIDSDAIVILFTGRLSFHAKAHPLAMYQAIDQLSAKFKLVLIECGWYANEHIEKAYQDAFLQICPKAKRITLDGRISDQRSLAWAGADIFCSLSDNIQETFGLTPLEAMAAGLPVIVSDWNGYKETVRDGVDGFRIPTYLPSPGLGKIFARQHELGFIDYDRYCGVTSQLVAVNIRSTVEALERLVKDPALRTQMGQSGREHVMNNFDWKCIIPQYEELWQELDSRRQHAQASPKLHSTYAPSRSSRMDPFELFLAYPTQTINESSYLMLSYGSSMTIEEMLGRLHQLSQLQMVAFAKEVHLSLENSKVIFEFLASGPKTVSEICALTNQAHHEQLTRSLLWLMKMGFLTLT